MTRAIDGEKLLEWLEVMFVNLPYGAVSAKVKAIYNGVESGAFDLEEAPKELESDDDQVRVIESRLKSISHVPSVDEWREAARLLLAKYNETLAQLEDLKKVYDVTNQSWRQMQERLTRAVKALEKIVDYPSGTIPKGNAWTDCVRIAHSALQSIKGADAK